MSRLNPLRLLLGAWLLAIATAAGAQDFPELTGRVVDAASILADFKEAELSTKLEAVEAETQKQFVIVTIPDLEGYDIADYGYRLGRHWGIGDAERNDGVLLIVAPNERKVRIEVGYGLDGELTDAWSSFIIQTYILPRFKVGDMAGGMDAGADAIIARIAPKEGVPLAAAPLVVEQEGRDLGDLAFVVVIFMLVFVLPFALIVIPILIFKKYFPERYKEWQANAAKRRSSGVRIRTGGSSRSYSSSRSFSSGRSFSGGGGSFGGGGSSGSW